MRENIEIIKDYDFDTLEMLYNNSALTFEGLIEEDISAVIDYLDNEYIEKYPDVLKDDIEASVYVISGERFNDFCRLTGNNAYSSDLTIISFNHPAFILAMSIGARWMDDIIDNNADREGSHPFDEYYFENN